jgi:hypothetical protein
MLTSLSEGLVTESCFADLEGVPFIAVERLIYINDIKVFVHPASGTHVREADSKGRREADLLYSPQFMNKVTHNTGPMLRRIRALVDFFGYHLSQPGLFCKPLASRTSYRMPAQLDSTGLLADANLTRRDGTCPLAESQLVLEAELSFEHIVLTEVRRSAIAPVRFFHARYD